MEFYDEIVRYGTSLTDLVYFAKRMNDKRGVKDNHHTTTESMMAILSYLCTIPMDQLEPKTHSDREKEISELEDHYKKLEELRIRLDEAKKGVDDVYKEVLAKFKSLSEDAPPSDAVDSLRDIIQSTVRDVVIDMNAIPVETTPDNMETETANRPVENFNHLFTDQGVFTSGMFSDVPPPPPRAEPFSFSDRVADIDFRQITSLFTPPPLNVQLRQAGIQPSVTEQFLDSDDEEILDAQDGDSISTATSSDDERETPEEEIEQETPLPENRPITRAALARERQNRRRASQRTVIDISEE